MARNVKISVFNSMNPTIDSVKTLKEAVGLMKDHLGSRVKQVLPDRPDLIVFPEFCDIPINYLNETLKAYYAERGDQILDMFTELAHSNRCYIAYPSYRLLEDGTWRNSIRMIDRSGTVCGVYNKNHPVVSEIVDDGVLCGKDASIMECDFGTLGFAICFDLNFDQIRLKYVQSRPDLILFCSAYHGGLMQQYWAYSCRAHFVGAIAGRLPGAIISPVGQILHSTTSYFDYVTGKVNLDCAVVHLDQNGERLAAMREKYGLKVKVTDPSLLGSVLITSETDGFTVKDMIEEYKFTLLDDYLNNALSYHNRPEFIENRSGL